MICENCSNEITEIYGSGRFCCASCARAYSTKQKRKEISEKVSSRLTGRKLSDSHKESIKKSWEVENRPRKINKNRKGLNELLVENSRFTTQWIKRRLLQENLLEYKCNRCPNTGTHNGKPLVLQLHHINGNNRDHRFDNLELLCPNCHTQTDNYGSKKR
jgi:5-methylcytosine-specific restriction endonuclease McrA